jgi:anti-sigma regulatory factor (Ser/Thr protein kinase)
MEVFSCERSFPVDRSAPLSARQFVAGTAACHIEDVDTAALVLLVSELVTNSVIHGGGTVPIEVGVTVGDRLRVEVTDHGGSFRLGSFGRRRAGMGFGLYLVEQLADGWGMSMDGVTRVWFELARRSQPATQSFEQSRRQPTMQLQ